MNFKDLRPIAKVRKEFRQKVIDKRDEHRCSTFGLLLAENKLWYSYSTICFAGLREAPLGSKALYVHLSDKYEGGYGDGKDFNESESKHYIDWLTNRSPWKDAFITKNARTIYKQRCAVLSTEVAGNLMGGGAVALRRLWETREIVHRWLDFVEVGVPETLSFFLACSSYNTKGVFKFGRSEGGHECLDTHLGPIGLHNFLSGKPSDVRESYSTSLVSTGYSYMWGGMDDGAQQFFRDKFPWKSEVAVVKAISNPFAKAVPVQPGGNGHSCDYKEALTKLANWWPEVYKWCGLNQPKAVVISVPKRLIKRDSKGRFAKKDVA